MTGRQHAYRAQSIAALNRGIREILYRRDYRISSSRLRFAVHSNPKIIGKKKAKPSLQ
jgi:hypothetical protein